MVHFLVVRCILSHKYMESAQTQAFGFHFYAKVTCSMTAYLYMSQTSFITSVFAIKALWAWPGGYKTFFILNST